MSKDIVFGIDIGGTSIKCGVFTVDGMLVKKERNADKKSVYIIIDDIAVYIKRTLIEEEIHTERAWLLGRSGQLPVTALSRYV